MSVQRFDELVAHAAKQCGVDHETARALVLSWFDVSRDALFAEKSQTLPGIGTLHLKWREAYSITNPRTGERQQVSARATLRFAEHAEMVRHFAEHHGIPVTKSWLAAHPKEVEREEEPPPPNLLRREPILLAEPGEEEITSRTEAVPDGGIDDDAAGVSAARPDPGDGDAREPETRAPAVKAPSLPSPSKTTPPKSAPPRAKREAPMMPPIPPREKNKSPVPAAPVPGPEFSRKALSRWVGKLPPSQVQSPVEESVVEASQPGLNRGKKTARPVESEQAAPAGERPEADTGAGAPSPRRKREAAVPDAPAKETEGDARLLAAETAILENLQNALPGVETEPPTPAAPAAEEVLLSTPPKRPAAFPVRAMVEGLIVGLVLALVIVGGWWAWPYLKRTSQPQVVTVHLAAGEEARPELPLIAGDTLPDLAEKIWGDRRLWVALYDANRTRIADPDNLVPGRDRLFVPRRPAGSLAESYLRLRETRPFDGPARQWERLLTAYSLDPAWVLREKQRLSPAEQRALKLQ